MNKRKLFLVDDDAAQIALLTAQLERSGVFTTEGFTDARRALERLLSEPPDGVVCDLMMPGMSGLEFTRRLRSTHPFLPVIIATGAGSTDDAAACFEAGASDFVTKPVDAATLIARVRKAMEDVPARELLVEAARVRFDPHGLVGSHPRVLEVRRFIDHVAAIPGVSVLILGESGTGKNLVARAIHAAGDVASFRFVEVNCAALPANLLEAELFGYEKGAFTDARQTKKGLVEEADGGTLFLDEIGSMPIELQAKLLTFLESRSFRRIGSTHDQSVSLRVIAATNTDLARQVQDGEFREDLFYRLNVASTVLPALREIPSDISELTRHFVAKAAEEFRRPVPRVEEADIRTLEAHSWPGNARELRNVVERAMIFSPGPTIRFSAETLGSAVGVGGRTGAAGGVAVGAGTGRPTGGLASSGASEQPGSAGAADPTHATGSPAAAGDAAGTLRVPRGLTLEDLERIYIQSTLEDVDGQVGEAAARLGLTRKVFWARRKKLGLV